MDELRGTEGLPLQLDWVRINCLKKWIKQNKMGRKLSATIRVIFITLVSITPC
jgi:hypothetical protein